MERFFLNLTDPQSELGETLSSTAFTHPALLEMTLQAISLAIDRGLLVEIGYGVAGRVTCNVLPAPASYATTVNECCML
ncbi:MAG: peptide ABC transporter substrate-binding protein, partial [Pseudomonadota bacterium]